MVNAYVSAQATTTTVASKSKENSYTKPGIDKCYKCGKPGHRFNECPKRKQVNVSEYGDEDE